MADRLVQLIDKDDYKIYPITTHQDDFILWDEVEEDNQIVSDMVGASSSADGKHGLAPEPKAGDEGKVLHATGKWDYPIGTILGYTEFTFGKTATNGTEQITALSTTPYKQFGPNARTGTPTIEVVVPEGEEWDILAEAWCACWAGVNGSSAWMGPAIMYHKSGQSDVKWASAIWTNRGVNSNDQWSEVTVNRVGTFGAGTWYFTPSYISASTSMYFSGALGTQYAAGPAYTLTVTLVNRKKV